MEDEPISPPPSPDMDMALLQTRLREIVSDSSLKFVIDEAAGDDPDLTD